MTDMTTIFAVVFTAGATAGATIAVIIILRIMNNRKLKTAVGAEEEMPAPAPSSNPGHNHSGEKAVLVQCTKDIKQIVTSLEKSELVHAEAMKGEVKGLNKSIDKGFNALNTESKEQTKVLNEILIEMRKG